MQIKNQNNPDTFYVEELDSAWESEMQSAWDRIPEGLILPLTDGSEIKILSRGIWNLEDGPAFLRAKIMHNGRILTGDIEFHRRSSDFLRKGHQQDSAYRHLLLSIAAEHDAPAEHLSAALPLCRLDKDSLETIPAAFPETDSGCPFPPGGDPDAIRTVLQNAGEKRIRLQAEKILKDMIETGTADAFRKALFQASGSHGNAQQFEDLFRRFQKYTPEQRKAHGKAILWGESGLLPDPAAETLPEENLPCIKQLWGQYWSLRRAALPPIEWKRDSLRPCGTPERRLAMLCSLLEKFPENPIAEWSRRLKTSGAEAFLSVCRKEFFCSDPFWEHRYTFRSVPAEKKTALCSPARILLLCTDVLVPAFLASAELEQDPELEERALQLFHLLPSTESNAVIRKARQRWTSGGKKSGAGLFSGAAVRQGCIHIYQTCCISCTSLCGACLAAEPKGSE